jgi:7-keto-8-aminopelargonate synthetase-like enzyme
LGGKTLLNFSSNDYLGLANEPSLKTAAAQAIERYGAGAGASRLVCGSLAPYHELDETIANFKGTAAALGFSTGYAAALGSIRALLSRDDVIITDQLIHASMVDGARLCGAKLRIFDHNDLTQLEEHLKWADERVRSPRPASASSSPAIHVQRPRTLVVTESIFSMDGDHAPLREIVELKDKYGAWLMVDEAHATGLYGPNRRGLAEEFGVGDRIEIHLGTLGKSFGAAGGYLCGSRTFIDFLVNRARTFIFSTAPVPAAAAAATAGIRFVQSAAGEERRNLLWQRVSELSLALSAGQASSAAPTSSTTNRRPLLRSAIIPLMIGDETEAMQAAAVLREQGIFIPAIRYPTVARGAARLRLTVTATHTQADIRQLHAALRSLGIGFRVSNFGV